MAVVLVKKGLKFHASWRPSCRASAGSPTSYCWTPVAGSFGGWCSPADRWWLIKPLLAAGPLCPGTASRPLQLLLRLGRSPSRLLSLLGGFSVTPSSPACSAPEAGLVSHSALRLPCGGILGLSRLSSPRPHQQLLPGRSNSFATAALLLPQLLPHSHSFSSTGPAFWRWYRRVGVQANSPLPPD